jgi:hypothetical protein
MAREFAEETGWLSSHKDWSLFRTERFANGAVVHFLWAHCVTMPALRTMEAERVDTFLVKHVLHPDYQRRYAMYNIPYLLEMAIAIAQLEPEYKPLP